MTSPPTGRTRTGRCWAPTDGRIPARCPGTLGGHRGSRIYGRLDCPGALRAIARGGYIRDRVFFLDEPAAIAAGYRPCWLCLREAYTRLEDGTGRT